MSEDLKDLEAQLRTVTSRLGNLLDRTDAIEVRAKNLVAHIDAMEERLLESGSAVLKELELIKSDAKDTAEKSDKIMVGVGNALVQRMDALTDKVKNININL